METFENKVEEANSFKYFPFFKKSQAILVLILLAIIFYGNSLYNEYALDDGIVIHQNNNVIKGVKGIPEIFTSDAYGSFYKRMCATDQLQGGRYRPLSIATFALEQEFIHPYRTGFYMRAEDCNRNGTLDNEKITYTTPCGYEEVNYEYNEGIDLDNDGKIQPNECNTCWDLNKNFVNDSNEDLNADGVFNEIDCQTYGAPLRHFNNILTYVLLCVFIYLLLSRYLFKNNYDLAFLASLIFLMHPVHTEVVANVRGRDDLFSLLFIVLALMFVFKFLENKKWSTLIACSFTYLLALFSKEYGLLMLVLIPLAIHVFEKDKFDWKNYLKLFISFSVLAGFLLAVDLEHVSFGINPIILSLIAILIFLATVYVILKNSFKENVAVLLMPALFAVTLLYLGLRFNAVITKPGVPDTELLNNAFLLATGAEEFATKIFVLLKYLMLMIFPRTLVSDYSYGTIPYKNFIDLDFILSLVIHLSILVAGIRLIIKKHFMGFAIISYFAFLIAAGNFVIGTGVIMLEANLFHASLGFSIALAWLILFVFDKISGIEFKWKRSVLFSILTILLVLCGCKTWERNRDWKNDVTLFLKDVANSPNSVLVLGNAGARWIDLADTKEITGKIIPGQDSTVFNDYNGTLKITEEELKTGGYKDKREAALNKGINYLKHAVELHPRYVNGYLNLGLAYFKLGNDFECIYYWKLAERLYPNNPYLNNYYAVYSNLLKNRGSEAFDSGDYKKSVSEYNKSVIVRPDNAEAWYNLGGAYYNMKNFDKAKTCWEKALRLNPDYEEAKKVLMLFPNTGIK